MPPAPTTKTFDSEIAFWRGDSNTPSTMAILKPLLVSEPESETKFKVIKVQCEVD